ncbi:hypothetical protein HID58_085904 [Brassica napus]|uniref:Uncharacterized protein n=1 Tax=Brassica napus TaxID=3708 RepID=A0ABQ7XP33_BRANA|nr:hypothetical protein HID58_085904 [Brassica napus]
MASTGEVSSGECSGSGSTAYGHSDYQQYQGLQPELFFKMSHEIYNYGEGYVDRKSGCRSQSQVDL